MKMTPQLLSWLRSIFALGFFVYATPIVFAQGCPPPPLPLEEAREHIEKTPAKNAGLLWRIEKSGRTSWLYGTMHLMHIDYAKPGPQIMMGMRNSDVLAVEVDIYSPQQTVEASQSPKFELSHEQLARLKSAYEKECIKSNPAQGGIHLLMISQASRQGLYSGYGPDARLMIIAKRTNKPIVQLEGLEQQVKALAPTSQVAFDEQIKSTLKSFEDGSLFSYLGVLARAWQRNDLQTFIQNTALMNEKDADFARRINDERNILMANKIDGLHMDGKRVFVAVGAVHMTGQYGIPKLLEAKGYTATFIPLINASSQ